MNSRLVRSTRALSDMPQWEQDDDNGQEDIMLLGDVKQKLPNIKCWMPRIHQLFLHVSTPQQSAPRVVRSCGYLEPDCSQLRRPMSTDDAPKKATIVCRREVVVRTHEVSGVVVCIAVVGL